MKKPNQNGFTLIELLVVIAIIAILAAILFPVFAQARAKARSASCLSNIKQLTLGWNMYAQDYDETYPLWRWDQSYVGGSPYPDDGSSTWWNAIYPYVKNAGVYQCPDNKYDVVSKKDGIWGWFSTNNNSQAWADKTKMNVAFADIVIGYGTSEPLTYDHPRMATMSKPAEIMLVADMATALSGWDCWDCYDPTVNKPENSYRPRRIAYPNGWDQPHYWDDPTPWITGPFNPDWDRFGRHSNGNNIGYADGHAKYRPVSRINPDLFGTQGR